MCVRITRSSARQSFGRFPLRVDGLPAIPGRDGAVRPEPLALVLELLRRQQVRQAVGERVALTDTVILDGPDVEPSKPEDEEHLRGPPSDPAADRELCDDLLVGQAADAAKRDRAARDFRGKIADG